LLFLLLPSTLRCMYVSAMWEFVQTDLTCLLLYMSLCYHRRQVGDCPYPMGVHTCILICLPCVLQHTCHPAFSPLGVVPSLPYTGGFCSGLESSTCSLIWHL
jgi:hypothetical protein